MLENIYYKNHLGETIKFDKSEHILIAHNDLRDYSWDYDTESDRITEFKLTGKTEKSLPVRIFGEADEAREARNRLFRIINADITANKPGAIWYGDYYMTGYIYESKKARYMPDYGNITLKFVTDNPYWIKENLLSFRPGQSIPAENYGNYKKYAYRYGYQYVDSSENQTVTNEALSPAPFILKIYGAAENPDIAIGQDHHIINTTLSAGQTLILTAIDNNKTIKRINANGTETNLFNSREKSIDVFKQIPTGTFNVSWDGDFTFDIIVFDRRSEPPWT